METYRAVDELFAKAIVCDLLRGLQIVRADDVGHQGHYEPHEIWGVDEEVPRVDPRDEPFEAELRVDGALVREARLLFLVNPVDAPEIIAIRRCVLAAFFTQNQPQIAGYFIPLKRHMRKY